MDKRWWTCSSNTRVCWIKTNFLLYYIVLFSTQLENDDIHAKLHKPSSKRSDTGKYKVQLKNDSGEDECDIDVIVLDKPGIPEGPLEATETTTDSVTLQWKPPKDNGGGDITGTINDYWKIFS